VLQQRSLHIFSHSIKSEVTKKVYLQNLEYFRKFCKLKDFDSILKVEPKQLDGMIQDYVISLKSQISPNSIPTRIYPIQTFFEVNDIEINWKKIRRLFPPRVKLSGAKAWTTQEIRLMLEVSGEIRTKALIHFLASSGVRIGAMPGLRLRHLAEMPLGCKSVTVYAEDPEEYYTFLSPEASKYLDLYLEHRKNDGENLSPDSSVFRTKYSIGIGKVVPLSERAMRTIIQRTQRKAGLRYSDRKKRYKV